MTSVFRATTRKPSKKPSNSKRTSGTQKIPRTRAKKKTPTFPSRISDARRAALMVLNTLQRRGGTLDGALEIVLPRFHLSSRDRALFHAVVYGVLRWKGTIDAEIEHFSRRPLDQIGPEVLNVLRIALFQIRFLDKIPVSAAVDTAVELTRTTAHPWAAGFVNALLRSAVRTGRDAFLPDPGKDPAAWLAASRSFPGWLVARWIERLGYSRTRALCEAQNEIPPITLRTNRLKVSRDRLVHALQEACEKVWPCLHAPGGVALLNPGAPIDELEAFRRGWFQVQDEAAQLVTLLLEPQPGETILDACAGRGGKTGHIAQEMNNTGRLFAWDMDAKKLAVLVSEMRRLGVSIVTPKRKDLERSPDAGDRMRFDRVLLDAPCSGLGVLRRNPDARWRIREKDLFRHQQKQLRLLDRAGALVKPGGVLVYAVCSMEPEENEHVIEAFLEKHPDFRLFPDPEKLPHAVRKLTGTPLYLKTSPLEHHMDGFFAARLEKMP